MNEIEFEKLRETSWRRNLTADEAAAVRSYLAMNPAARAGWEEESSLNEFLGQVPDVPVSSNFTARVLQAVEGEISRSAPRPRGVFGWVKLRWPRIAAASAMAFVIAFSAFQYRELKREQMARDIVAMSQAAKVPQEWLQDFEVINRLSQPPVDEELLAALQ